MNLQTELQKLKHLSQSLYEEHIKALKDFEQVETIIQEMPFALDFLHVIDENDKIDANTGDCTISCEFDRVIKKSQLLFYTYTEEGAYRGRNYKNLNNEEIRLFYPHLREFVSELVKKLESL